LRGSTWRSRRKLTGGVTGRVPETLKILDKRLLFNYVDSRKIGILLDCSTFIPNPQSLH
jgi:hypothetical protein